MQETSAQKSSPQGISYLYMAAAFVIVVAGMRAAESIVNPLLLAIFLSVLSAPAYFGLRNRNVSNWLALLIVIGVLSATVVVAAFVIMQSIAGFTSRQDHYADLLSERTRGIRGEYNQWVEEWSSNDEGKAELMEKNGSGTEPVADDDAENSKREDSANGATAEPNVTDNVNLTAKETPTSESPVPADFGFPETRQLPKDEKGMLEYMSQQFELRTVIALAANIAGSIGLLLSNTFLILLTVVFILLEAGTFKKKIQDAFARTDDATPRAQEILANIHSYIVVKTWVSLATGLLIAAWLWFLGVPHFALWGLLAFLFNFIPNIGSVLAAIPAVMIAWLELTTLPAVAAGIGFLFVNISVGSFIEPRLMGKGLGLSPLVVFFSMVFWGWVLGPVGMLLSVPLTMTARIALDGFEDTRWVATLLSNAAESA